MKRAAVIGISAALFVTTSFPCSIFATENTTQDTTAQSDTAEQEKTESKTSSASNILIAYFTWADNTEVENPDEIDVDASTSASVLAPGNAAMMAQWIQEETGGDLFSIQVTEPYSSDYDTCLDRAADEKAEDARPELKTHVENMNDYNIVFLGFPNWWYTIPMAIHSFVEEYDFSGKTVIPFVTHGTGGLANCINDLTDALPESTQVLEPIGVYRDDVKDAQPEIQQWISNMGIDFSQKDGNEANDTENIIRVVMSSGEILIQMDDNSASEDLISRLPLTMSFEDYNNTERISYLDSELDTGNAPDECTPQRGDLTYYAPWGNLAFFCKDFRQSPQLVPLGKVIDGEEYLDSLDKAGQVTLELYEK